MDDAQKFNIPLNSPLDINSNDVLVKAAQPSFAFNRQRFLGSLLQSSIRYEDDGWFAGWWGHTFDPVAKGTMKIEPPLGEKSRLTVTPQVNSDGWPYYKVRQGDKNVSFTWAYEDYVKWIVGRGVVSRTGDNITVDGTTDGGEDWTLVFNVYTGAQVSFTSSNPELVATIDFSNGLFKINVERAAANDWLQLRPNRPLTVQETRLSYWRDATKSYFGEKGKDDKYLFELTDNNVLTCNDPTIFTINSQSVVNPGTTQEHVVAALVVNADITIEQKFNITYKWWKDLFNKDTVYWYNDENKGVGATVKTHTVVGYTAKELETMPSTTGGAATIGDWATNKQEVNGISHSPAVLDPRGSVRYSHMLPIWLLFQAQVRTSLDYTAAWDEEIFQPDGTPYDPPQYIHHPAIYAVTITKSILRSSIDDTIDDTINNPNVVNAVFTGTDGFTLTDPVFQVDPITQTVLPIRRDYSFRLYNNNPNYPIAVNSNYWTAAFSIYIYQDGSYTIIPRQTTTLPNGVVQVVEAGPTLTLGATSAPYFRYFNAIDGLTPGVITRSGSGTQASPHVVTYKTPLCVPGYAISEITTPNIIASNTSAFDIAPVSNATLGIKCWRIDKGGPNSEGMNDWALGKVQAQLNALQELSTNGVIDQPDQMAIINKVLVVELNANVTPLPAHDSFFYLLKEPKKETAVWPSWCDTAGSWVDNANAVKYIPQKSALIVAQINLKVQYIGFISSSSGSDVAVEPVNQFTTQIAQAIQLSTQVQEPNDTFVQQVTINCNTSDHTIFDFDNATQNSNNVVNSYTRYQHVSTAIATDSKDKQVLVVTIKLKTNKAIESEFWRTFIYQKEGIAQPISIVEQINKSVKLTDGYGTIDLSQYNWVDATLVKYLYNFSPDNYSTFFYLTLVGMNSKLQFRAKGITQKVPADLIDKGTTEDDDNYYIAFEYDGEDYVLTLSKDYSVQLSYDVTDIRNGEKKNVYLRDVKDIKMLVKQFWSATVDIENYWWIDEFHVLELSKYYMTLYEKLPTLHDWMGDNWKILKRANRSMFFTTDDLYYNVSYALRSIPYLFKFQTPNNYTIRLMVIKDIFTADWDNLQWETVDIPVEKTALSNALPPDKMGCFVQLMASSVINRGKISSTVVDGTFILAIKLNRGLQQWTFRFTDSLDFTVMYGYGNVGLDGSLTGGMVPDIACDSVQGFNQPVFPLTDLIRAEAQEWQVLPNKCYGTADCVWFIYNKVNRIVSHFTFENGVFVPHYLALNNNISVMYQNESFKCQALFDYLPQSINIVKLLGDDSPGMDVLNVLAEVTLPSIFYLNIFYSICLYLNQSLGMYAYKWFNSTQQTIEAAEVSQDQRVADIDVSFYKALFYDSCHENTAVSLWVKILTRGVELLATNTDFKPNAGQNQTAVSDSKGGKWSSFVVDNVSSLITTALDAYGSSLNLKSEVSLKYNLKQFYNISNKQECYAGPGFTNLQLTAQCIAQSCTDFQLEGQRTSYWITLKQLTALVIRLRIMALDLAIEAIEAYSTDTAGSETSVAVGGLSMMIPLSPAIAAAAVIATSILKATRVFWVTALEVVCGDGGLCDIIGPSRGEARIQTKLQKKAFDVEAPHAYGTKPMSFMWPCFGIEQPCTYTNEAVQSTFNTTHQRIKFNGTTSLAQVFDSSSLNSTLDHNKPLYTNAGLYSFDMLNDDLYSVYISCLGTTTTETAPEDMAVIEGVTKFLPLDSFKQLNIGESEPIFSHPPLQDYIIDKSFDLGVTAIGGEQFSLSVDDTKIIDGAPSNIVINDDFCGVASSYIALEVKNQFDYDYLRPWAITPNTIALNINRVNTVHDAKAYHAFHGEGRRIIQWTGGAGLRRDFKFQHFWFEQNDHFKRSNIYPPAHFQGDFQCAPSLAVRSYSKIYNDISSPELGIGLKNDVPGENRSLIRVSLPVFSETLNTLPAMVRMLAPYKLAVVEGVTSLCTDARYGQTAYKAPSSIDFDINGASFRATEEFVCTVAAHDGVVDVKDTVASAGLQYVGATTSEAYFYSPATRMYYSFSGGRTMTKKDIFNRFKDIKEGRWDYVNQEVMFKCLLANRMNEKPDLWHDTIIGRLEGQVLGELYPPPPPIYDQTSDFKMLSMAGGLCYQGPKRFVVNRFVINEHMYDDLMRNKRRWKKLSRDLYMPERDYMWEYADWHTETPPWAVKGWTHNPYRLVTSMLGISEEVDCKFEWELTFAWTEQMDKLFEQNEFVTVNLQAETVTQGGTLTSPVTHVFLFKECFTRAGNAGYYTFQFNGKNGMGNRERLYVWSDGISALEDLQLYCKSITQRRTQPLHTQVDVQGLKEQ